MLSPSLFIQWCFHFILAKGKRLSSNGFNRWVWFGDDNKSNAFNIGLLFIGSSVCCWWPPKTSLASAATSSGQTSDYLRAFEAAWWCCANWFQSLMDLMHIGCLVGFLKQENHLAYLWEYATYPSVYHWHLKILDKHQVLQVSLVMDVILFLISS